MIEFNARPPSEPTATGKEAGTNPEADELIGKSLEAKGLFSSGTSSLLRGVLWRMFESSDGKDS